MTEVLRQAGVLDGRVVRDIEVLDVGAFNSDTVRVKVELAGSETLRFVLKRPADTAWSVEAARDGARFYRLVAGLPDHPYVVPRCFAVGPEDDSFVLLEDLSATHRPPITRAKAIDLVDRAWPPN